MCLFGVCDQSEQRNDGMPVEVMPDLTSEKRDSDSLCYPEDFTGADFNDTGSPLVCRSPVSRRTHEVTEIPAGGPSSLWKMSMLVR